ncbi:MAG: EVE domain-containing protein [Okeania sp. SIO2C2]|uniref:EVE domain-containing protein n=1 Tax=Okeania sp. SIO2C2 TaxID=2607787 RepID=UPI0013B718F1|nr:EVE domain-containing protein [Okeania sp. SIO2C2]NEP90112.1 EVE domain-containing protein [Okeania sp. SIO2C2]
MKYWLMKSEPKTYSISDMKLEKTCIWDGVRNYQARNFLRQMIKGDLAFFYHSNTVPPGIIGLVKILESGIADPTQFDPKSQYYDPKSTPNSPRWQTVSVEFVEKFPQLISLAILKQEFSPDELLVTKKGNRLSVMPVAQNVAEKILVMKDGF